MAICLAVDAMGGDAGLSVTVAASLSFLLTHADCTLVLVGLEQDINQQIADLVVKTPAYAGLVGARGPADRVSVVHASQVVAMDEAPALALRTKRDSSMRVGAQLVKEGRASALVSAGNTGALMAISRYVLRMMDGIERPAIAAQLPNSVGGATTMLDLGANVDCEPEHYLQFAIMGAALAQALDGTIRPRIGLLNIGEELIKGNETVKKASELLAQSSLNFIGNVEGNDIFNGRVDVIVCDGFVGNVALKTSEGLAQMFGLAIREEFSRTWLVKLAGLIALPVLKRFKARFDHRRYNGASLIGLRGVVIKSHGSADAVAFETALRRAYDAVRNDVLGKISASLAADVHGFPAQAMFKES